MTFLVSPHKLRICFLVLLLLQDFNAWSSQVTLMEIYSGLEVFTI